jgi:hypothetical protein
MDYYNLFLELRYATEAAHKASAISGFSQHNGIDEKTKGQVWVDSEMSDVMRHVQDAVGRLGYELAQRKPIPIPHGAPQDIDAARDDYSAGLSGRVAS